VFLGLTAERPPAERLLIARKSILMAAGVLL
jgi:hypothetical protein